MGTGTTGAHLNSHRVFPTLRATVYMDSPSLPVGQSILPSQLGMQGPFVRSMTDNRTPARSGVTSEGQNDSSAEELLSLFGDEYTCCIIRALTDGPMAARELVDATGMSRPTAYRRLDRLTDAGLVAERLQVASDGHHRTEFRLAVDAVEFEVGGNGFHGRVHPASPDRK